jgi:hypothetical protein
MMGQISLDGLSHRGEYLDLAATSRGSEAIIYAEFYGYDVMAEPSIE